MCIRQTAIYAEKKNQVSVKKYLQAQLNGMSPLACLSAIHLS